MRSGVEVCTGLGTGSFGPEGPGLGTGSDEAEVGVCEEETVYQGE